MKVQFSISVNTSQEEKGGKIARICKWNKKNLPVTFHVYVYCSYWRGSLLNQGYNKDGNIHKSEALNQKEGQTNNNSCRVSELNQQIINF